MHYLINGGSRLRFVYIAAMLLISAVGEASAAEKDWANTSTDFNSNSSWSPNMPGSSDVAWFKTGKVTDPNITGDITIIGLYFGNKAGGTSSSGYHITSSNSAIQLSLIGAATDTSGPETTNNSAAAIGADNTSGINTIDGQIRLIGANNTTQTFYQAAGGTLIANGTVSSANTIKLNLNGGGTLRLSGNNSYTGGTLITSGRLEAASENALSTGAVTVNSGGSLVFTNSSATNRMSNSAGLTLAGGTFARSGSGTVSEGSGRTVVNGTVTGGTNVVGIGALTLNASSTLDFGNDGGRGTFVFSSFIPNANVLNVLNWTNTHANKVANTSGVDGSDDRLIFDQDQTTNLAFFNFGAGLSAAEIGLNSGFFEVVPVTEPGTGAAAGLALSSLLVTQRRRFKNLLWVLDFSPVWPKTLRLSFAWPSAGKQSEAAARFVGHFCLARRSRTKAGETATRMTASDNQPSLTVTARQADALQFKTTSCYRHKDVVC